MELSNTFEMISDQMIKELGYIKAGPNELKGKSREIVLRKFLQPFVPTNMEVASRSVVISVNGENSGEIDLLVYDEKNFSLFKPLFGHYPEGSNPVPAETVYGVFEVEKELTVSRARHCSEKIKKVKALPKTAYYKQSGPVQDIVTLYGKQFDYYPTMGVIFTFDANPQEVLPVLKEVKDELEHQVDLVCILKRGLICWYDSAKKQVTFPPEPGSELVFIRGEPKDNLRLLYIVLTRIFSQAWTHPVCVYNYFKLPKK